MPTITKFDFVFTLRLIAALLSCFFVLYGLYAPEKTLSLYPLALAEVNGFADVDEGGNSIAHESESRRNHIVCELASGARYPVCGVSIKTYREDYDLSTLGKFIPGESVYGKYKSRDLSSYTGIRFDFHYKGEAKRLRAFIRSVDTSTDQITDINKEKIAAAYIHEEEFNQSVDILLTDFFIADWWINQNDKRRVDSKPNLEKFFEVSIDLPQGVPMGIHEITLNTIEAYGSRITMETAYLAVIIVLLMLIFIELAYRYVQTLYRSGFYQESLQELQEKYEVVKTESYRDELTGIYNRRGFNNLVNIVSQKSRSRVLGLFVIDIDFFKKINDTHGHATGDSVLQGFSELLQSHCRSSDVVARWGGEEFVVLSEEDNRKSIELFAERLRKAVEEHVFVDGSGGELKITVSMGLTTVENYEAFNISINRADDALYKAKTNGRNCYYFFNP